MARNNADSGETIYWLDTTAGEDLTNKEGYCVMQSGETFVLNDGASTDAAARRIQSFICARGEKSGNTVSVVGFGIEEVIVGSAATVGQYAQAKASNARVIPVAAADLRPGDYVLGEFVTAQATAGQRALLDAGKGFRVRGNVGVRHGNVVTATLAADRTLTTDEVLTTSLFVFDPGGAGRALTWPTAAALVAAGMGVGDSVEFLVENSADAAEALTPTIGTGFTIDTASPALAQNKNAKIVTVITNATASSEAGRIYVFIS